jgi:hypothetical protein
MIHKSLVLVTLELRTAQFADPSSQEKCLTNSPKITLIENKTGREVKKMNRKVAVLALAFALSMILATVAPAFAWDLHVPEGVKLFYSTGGDGSPIDLPADFPLNVAPWYADQIRFTANYIEGGNSFSGAELLVYLHLGGSFNTWSPWAHLITSSNPADVVWLRQFWYALPPTDVDNTKSIPAGDLEVDRHGNIITISLKTPQQMVAHLPRTVWMTLPAFDLELTKVGGNARTEVVWVNNGFGPLPGSGWTLSVYETGFNGIGAFTCPAWGYHAEPLADCFVTMHEIKTYAPP